MKKDESNQSVFFESWEITGFGGQVLRRGRPLALSPKAVAVLWTLIQRPGHVVSKEELFAAVWPDTIVSEGVLTNRIQEIRHALRDTPTKARYIETVSRRGYRFLPTVTTHPLVPRSTFHVPSSPPTSAPDIIQEERDSLLGTWHVKPETCLVGRERELAQLHALYTKALQGERQVVFVTGEAGIGKTALVDAFLAGIREQATGNGQQQTAADWQRAPGARHKRRTNAPLLLPDPRSPLPGVWVGWGQCIEHYGAGEAYLPLLEALSGLCRQSDGAQVLSVLRRVAPTWLIQLPALLEEEDYAALQAKVAGATRERMLREIVEAVEALSAEQPLVLVLEDAHWSDASTMDLLNLLARRRARARILALATSRQAELVVANHPLKTLKQELATREYATEMVLGGLPVAAVQQYVHQRFAVLDAEAELATILYRRTEGHPLFMVQLADYLLQRETLAELTPGAALEAGAEAPQQLRQLIEVQVTRLTADEQRLLEAGSVAGVEFTLASVAAAIEKPIDEIETQCEQLSQQGQFIVERDVSRWPDGTVSGRYGFRHALYQEVLYQRLSASRRVRFHQCIGEREAAGYGEHAAERAAELAMHFERGQQPQQAITYYYLAAGVMVQRQAHQEAIASLRRALDLLYSFPDSLARASQELSLHVLLGVAFMASKGLAAPEAEAAYARARALCQRLGDTPGIIPALVRLLSFYTFRGELPLGAQLADQVLHLVQQRHDPESVLEAHLYKGIIEFLLGNWAAARRHCETVLSLYDATTHHLHAFHYGLDPGIIAHSVLALLLWHLGYPAQARQQSQQALTFAAQYEHAPSVAIALWLAIFLRAYQREWAEVQRLAIAMRDLVSSQGLMQWVGCDLYAQGWARAAVQHEEADLALMAQGLAAYRKIGADLGTYNMQVWLAEQYSLAGHFAEAQRLFSEMFALLSRTQEVAWSGDFFRLKGEMILAQFHARSPASAVREKQKAQGKRQKETRGWRQETHSSSPDLSSPIPNPASEAEEYFLKAIEIARAHQAKSFELRAVMSLARLRRQQASEQEAESAEQGEESKSHATRSALAEAYTMLSEVYAWFTEGFDTQDLQEAKALLEELRALAKRGSNTRQEEKHMPAKGRPYARLTSPIRSQ